MNVLKCLPHVQGEDSALSPSVVFSSLAMFYRTWHGYQAVGLWFPEGFSIVSFGIASSIVVLAMNPDLALLSVFIGNGLVMIPS